MPPNDAQFNTDADLSTRMQLVSTKPHSAFASGLSPRVHVFSGGFEEHSRARRKGRAAFYTSPAESPKIIIPRWPPVSEIFPVADISYHVALWFTLGSACWIVNGHYMMWPLADKSRNKRVQGYSAVAGGTLFLVGAYLAVVESLNERSAGESKGKVVHVVDPRSEPLDVQRYVQLKNETRKSRGETMAQAARLDFGKRTRHGPKESWRWFGLQTNSLGWWASTIQFAGANAFFVSVVSGAPNVLGSDAWQLELALVAVAQVIGSICFALSSAIQLLEEQENWYTPEPLRIGWHAAFWNLIGSIGFFFSAVFLIPASTPNDAPCCQYWGTGFNSYYGSWAFLISSVAMLVEVVFSEGAEWHEIGLRAWAWLEVNLGCVRGDRMERDVEDCVC